MHKCSSWALVLIQRFPIWISTIQHVHLNFTLKIIFTGWSQPDIIWKMYTVLTSRHYMACFSPVQFTRFYALSILEHKTHAGLFPLNSVLLTFHALTQSRTILSEVDLEFSTQKETISSSNIFVTSPFNFQMWRKKF